MKLSSRGHYGLQAMVYLAKSDLDRPIPLRQIAADEFIPEQFLEQILADLRKSGLIRSVRGPKGGYLLADSPENIVVGDIIRVLEGSMNIVNCLEKDDVNCCIKTNDCSTKIVWEKLKESMVAVLDKFTLADIIKSDNTINDKNN